MTQEIPRSCHENRQARGDPREVPGLYPDARSDGRDALALLVE